jgi:hypothetical protein
MKSADMKKGISKTTIILSVVLVMLVAGAILFFKISPQIHKYYVVHRNYKVYGGMTDELKDSEFYEDMLSGKSFCFLGDSITAGSVTEDIPWYQPLIPYISGTVSNFSRGGWTVSNLIDKADNIPEADIYVIAIGINDILFPEDEDSAPTALEFAARCKELGELLTNRSPGSKIYFILPWSFIDSDTSFVERGNRFRSALAQTCIAKGYGYINPDPVIQSVIEDEGASKYMYNDFHPNAPDGIGLYCYAVLMDAHKRSH